MTRWVLYAITFLVSLSLAVVLLVVALGGVSVGWLTPFAGILGSVMLVCALRSGHQLVTFLRKR